MHVYVYVCVCDVCLCISYGLYQQSAVASMTPARYVEQHNAIDTPEGERAKEREREIEAE